MFKFLFFFVFFILFSQSSADQCNTSNLKKDSLAQFFTCKTDQRLDYLKNYSSVKDWNETEMCNYCLEKIKLKKQKKGEFKNGNYVGVSKPTKNEIAQTQNIKKVEDEQQTIEQDSRIEKQYKAQEKKAAELRQKAVAERGREYQEEERKKLEEEERAENERKRLEAEQVCLNRKKGTFTSAVCFIVEDTFKSTLLGETFSPNRIIKVDEKECTIEVKGINNYKMDWNKVNVNTIEFGDNGTNGWIRGEGAEGVMSNDCGFIMPCARGTFKIMMQSRLHPNSVDRSRINKALSSIYSNYCVGQESEF